MDEGSSEARPEETATDSGPVEPTAESPIENIDENNTGESSNISALEKTPEKLLREEIWYNSENGNALTSYRYEYDEAGRLIRRTNYSDSGEVKSWQEYEYDSNGRKVYEGYRYGEHRIEGDTDTWSKYEYNENGKIVYETRGGGDSINGYCNYTCDYEYDILGKLVSSTSYSSVTALTVTSEYDDNENKTKETTLDRNSGETILREYEYDHDGHLIKTTQTASALTIVIQEAEYDRNGNQLETKTYNSDGSISTWHEYGYDSMGNETKHISYNSDGSIGSWIEREYDNDGKIIKETSYHSDGSIDFENEYQYNDHGDPVTFSQDAGGLAVGANYEYDEDGNKIKETGLGCWIEYIYE